MRPHKRRGAAAARSAGGRPCRIALLRLLLVAVKQRFMIARHLHLLLVLVTALLQVLLIAQHLRLLLLLAANLLQVLLLHLVVAAVLRRGFCCLPAALQRQAGCGSLGGNREL